MEKEVEQYIREGKKLMIKEVFAKDLFAALGGSLPETTIDRLVDKIDKIYYNEEA
jgi:hypothetical protein